MFLIPENALLIGLFLLLPLAAAANLRETPAFALNITEVVVSFFVYFALTGWLLSPSAAISALTVTVGLVLFAFFFRALSSESIKLKKKQRRLKEEAEALAAQNRKISLILDNLTEGLIATDEEGKINLINESALRFVGFRSQRACLGLKADNFFKTFKEDEKISIFSDVLKKEKAIEKSNLRIIKNKESLILQISATPIFGKDKKIIGAVLVFKDVTSEKEIERQRAEFNAIVSHELRTPLTIIDGCIYNLQNNTNLIYDRQTKYLISELDRTVKSVIRLTNDVLAVSKLESNQINVDVEKVNIVKIIGDLIKNYQSEKEYKGRKINFTHPKKMHPIISDPQKVSEIFSNLIDNALKFSKSGPIEITIRRLKNKVRVDVADRGIGINDKDKKKIFSKFYRPEDWETRKTGGTGLGLYIVKTYLDALGGKISVESTLNKGSVFSVYLPAESKPKKIPPKTERQLDEFIADI